MAIQYYSIQQTGKKYALDKATGKVQEISSIPSGGAISTWNANGLPDELSRALSVSSSNISSTQAPSSTSFMSSSDVAAANEAERQRIAAEEAARKKEEQRQYWLREAYKNKGGFGSPELAQKFMQSVPAEFQTDVGNFLGMKISAESKTGDPIKDAILKAAQDFLDKLANRGQVLNPNIEITPEKIAEFTAQAQRELSPYYQSQMKLARESLLKSVGYSIEDIGRNEQDLEKKYGTSLRTLGESAAEKGFALSGMRKRDEEQLAYETQQNIDLNRRTLGRQAESLASTYAQKYGGTDMPTSTISQAPRVLPGEINFQKSDAQNPFYTLSPETYQNLVGSQQYEQQTAEKTRVAGLKSDYKTDELSKRMRTLSL